MSQTPYEDSALHLIELIKRKAPGYLDLVLADTDIEFEKAFTAMLEQAVRDLECNKVLFRSLGEDGLTSALAMRLTVPGLTVSRETNSNGHVDITITADFCHTPRKKIGEAKIWDGPRYHIGGLDQLLKRYATGREGRSLMIAYFKKANIKGLVQKLRKVMDKVRPCRQCDATSEHSMKWSFLSTHLHSSGENMEVAHIGCNLFVEGEEVPNFQDTQES